MVGEKITYAGNYIRFLWSLVVDSPCVGLLSWMLLHHKLIILTFDNDLWVHENNLSKQWSSEGS